VSSPSQPEHGVKAVRDKVAALLVADLPTRITRMTSLWGLDAGSIPGVDMVTSGEAADNALDARGKTWIEVVTPRLLPRTRTMDLTSSGSAVNRYRYSARIYVWAVADRWAQALDDRDRLAGAVRDSLFDYPTLAVPPVVGDTGFLLNSSTISEEYGEPYRIKRQGGSPRVWAPALLSYEIDHEYNPDAVTTREDWGVFNGIDLFVTLLPYSPVGG
jgi:hypothetical protein